MSNTAVNNQLIDAETKINNQLNKINYLLFHISSLFFTTPFPFNLE